MQFAPALSGRLLDVGCGSKPYKTLFHVDDYIGLELDSDESRKRGYAEHFYDGVVFPFSDDFFDCVLCNQVLEHVFNPPEFLSEINRVLKLGGRLLLTAPFVWDEHEQPNDYARYSSYGLKALMNRYNFKVLKQKKSCADASVIFQMINAYLFKIINPFPKWIRLFLTITIIAAINIIGVMISKVLPNNNDLYLDNIILLEKIG